MHWNYGHVRPSKSIDMGNGIKLNIAEKKIYFGDVTIEPWGSCMQAFKFYSRWSLKVFVHSNSLLIMCATLHPVSLQTGYLLDVAKRFYGMWILRKPVEVYLSVVHSMCTATRVQTYSNTQSVSHMGKAQVERQVHQPTSSTPNKCGR